MKEKIEIHQFRNLSTQEQFNIIVKTYSQDLYWVIRPIVKTHENADDVLQNTLIKIYRYLPKFRFESKLYSWMYRIAVNESLSYLKKYIRHDTENINDLLVEKLKSDDFYSGDAMMLVLEKAVLSLPEKQQEIFRLKYFSKMTFSEISDLLGTSIGGLKASYHIAVKKIKEKISN